MTESSHDLVEANKQRIWEIYRVVGSKRDDTVASPTSTLVAADEYGRRLWAN